MRDKTKLRIVLLATYFLLATGYLWVVKAEDLGEEACYFVAKQSLLKVYEKYDPYIPPYDKRRVKRTEGKGFVVTFPMIDRNAKQHKVVCTFDKDLKILTLTVDGEEVFPLKEPK